MNITPILRVYQHPAIQFPACMPNILEARIYDISANKNFIKYSASHIYFVTSILVRAMNVYGAAAAY